MGYGSDTYSDLKISVLAKTSHYGCEIMYNFVDFVYIPKYKDDNEDNIHNNTRKDDDNKSIFTNLYFYIGIGAGIIAIVLIIVCYIFHKRKSNKSDYKFDLPRTNSKLLNEI